MMKMIESLTGGYASSAKVVDGTLILSLPDALSPVVWRMELGSVRSSALEVREKPNQTFVLTLKTPREDVHEIAPFATRGQAVRALMAVSRALEGAAGHIRTPAAANDAEAPVSRRQPGGRRWAAGLGALVVILLLVMMIRHQGPQAMPMSEDSSMASATPTAAGAAPVSAAGVPVSADDYLRDDKTTK